MLLVIDNYDSFTYNLVQYFGELGQKVKVLRNDEVNLDQIEDLNPEFIVISPGPCTPNEAGISIEAIKEFSGKIPILGVCLGHQAIGAAFGAKIIKANHIMHGKISNVIHDGSEIFKNINFNFKTIENRLRELAFLNKGIKIILNDFSQKKSKSSEFK